MALRYVSTAMLHYSINSLQLLIVCAKLEQPHWRIRVVSLTVGIIMYYQLRVVMMAIILMEMVAALIVQSNKTGYVLSHQFIIHCVK
jgi:hypothetical protein